MTDTRKTKSAVYLIDDDMIRTVNHPVPSGWDYDQRGAIEPAVHKFGRGWFTVSTDKQHKNPVVMKRKFMPLRDGKAEFALTVYIGNGDGFFLNFHDVDDNCALSLKQCGNSLICQGSTLPVPFLGGYQYIQIRFDLDTECATVLLDGRECATLSLSSSSIACLRMGYDEDSEGEFSICKVALWINYLVCDRNLIRKNGAMPEEWLVFADEGANAYSSNYYEGHSEFTYALHALAGSAVCAYHPFKETSGKVCFELKYLTKNEDGENLTVALTSGEEDCVIVTDNGSSSRTTDGKLLRTHTPYVWQTLRIEADTSTQKAFIKHNGLKCGEIDFDKKCDFFDGISVTYSPEKDGYMRFTDVFVFEMQPEPADYPKPPVRPTKLGNYTLGMNVCSLWRNGDHWGWDAITSFDDNKTFLGYYDEPFTEVADWEIKWMVEHGIDAQLYCWFDNQTTAPIFKTHICGALDDGYFNAKYCDEMNFALIWEAANAASPDLDGFKKYLVPYWVDHYFSHPNYYRIDNMAVLSIFGVEKAVKSMGGAETFKVALDYLREVLKGMGYSGLIVMTCGDPTESLYTAGIDAVYAYNWGHQSYSAEYTKTRILSQLDFGKMHVVPTACVGYNDVAWREFRSPMMTTDDLGNLLGWIKDDLLPTYKEPADSWNRKFVMLATWNEYGEGTFICPSNLYGFGYLNEIRKQFTVEGDAYDSDRPSKEALDRLGYLYPKGRAIIQTPQLEKQYGTSVEVFNKIRFDNEDSIKLFRFEGEGFVKLCDGALYGESTGEDPKLIMPTSFNASDVSLIKVKVKSVNGNGDLSKAIPETCPVFCHYTTDQSPEWHFNKTLQPRDFDDEYIIFLPEKEQLWKGTIQNFRIDPCTNEGKFMIEEIIFYTNTEKPYSTYINNVPYNSHYTSRVENGEVYVPFEPLRDFCALTTTYHEYDVETGTVMIQYSNIKSYWTKGSDVVSLSNGEKIHLEKPLEFYDNLPLIQLSAFCTLTGYKYSVSGQRIDITY